MSLKSRLREWFAPAAMDLDHFDEAWYLLKYPDVAEQVASGRFRSGREHFIRCGFAERRRGSQSREAPSAPDCFFDAFKVTAAGAVFVSGSINGIAPPIDSVIIEAPGVRLRFAGDEIHRHQRADIEAELDSPPGLHEYGFWLFAASAGTAEPGDYRGTIHSTRSVLGTSSLRPKLISDTEMRDLVLGFFDTRSRTGSLQHKDVLDLEQGFGDEIIALNRRILRQSRPVAVSRFGPASRRITKTFVTCLYGLPEFLPLQVALFSNSKGFSQLEFVYVNNSPEHGELLEREARQAAHLYEVPITVVHSGANIGFAAANNLAVRHANSDRLLLVNPDVLPKDDDWLLRHDEFAATPGGKFFGARLYYENGSVMHAGMYFSYDSSLGSDLKRTALLASDHFAKGFPEWVPDAVTTRIVPAVTGAFMSLDRAHFEALGGFDEDYIFGHYEDGDLCLRSAAAGQPVWYCADVHLWHMESMGSTKWSHHDGAKRVNRWHVTRKWLPVLQAAGTAGVGIHGMTSEARRHAP